MLFLYKNLPVHDSFYEFINHEKEYDDKDNIDNYFFVGPNVRNLIIHFTIFDDENQLFTFCMIVRYFFLFNI